MAGLAGHLLRGMTTVEQYLRGPEPAEAPISAAAYFQMLAGPADLDDPANEAVRNRG